jgi:7,8-dihydro-6-hydroxymethylpterin dimethyltransferase
MPIRKYTYYDFTISLCPECLKRIDAKIVFEDGNVFMLKKCPKHGNFKVLIADDIEYYKNIRNYNKPSLTSSTQRLIMAVHTTVDCALTMNNIHALRLLRLQTVVI